MIQKFQGTGLTLVTPFHRYGTIDFSSIEKIIENALAKGVNFLVTLSSFAEVASLSRDEKTAVRNVIADIVCERVPVISGIKADNTQESINIITRLDYNGIDALMVDCPLHNGKPKRKGMFNHFKQIAGVSKVPVFLLNGNNSVSSNLNVEVMNDLVHFHKNIIGVVDFCENFDSSLDILTRKNNSFIYISGDPYAYPLTCMGANACTSLLANALPEQVSGMIEHLKNMNFPEAKETYSKIYPILKLVYEEAKVPPVKALIDFSGLGANNLRLPLVKVKKSVLYKLKKLSEMTQQIKYVA